LLWPAEETRMPTAMPRLVAALAIMLLIAGCASTGVGPQTAPDDPKVAEFSTADAIASLNAYRQAAGAPAVTEDEALDTQAVQLASRYALLGEQTQPAGLLGVLYVTGGRTFADSLTALRGKPLGAAALTNPAVTKAGVGSISLDGATAAWVFLLN
jgi:hypothetical protein